MLDARIGDASWTFFGIQMSTSAERIVRKRAAIQELQHKLELLEKERVDICHSQRSDIILSLSDAATAWMFDLNSREDTDSYMKGQNAYDFILGRISDLTGKHVSKIIELAHGGLDDYNLQVVFQVRGDRAFDYKLILPNYSNTNQDNIDAAYCGRYVLHRCERSESKCQVWKEVWSGYNLEDVKSAFPE